MVESFRLRRGDPVRLRVQPIGKAPYFIQFDLAWLQAEPSVSANPVAAPIFGAAQKLLATLTDEQRAKLIFNFQDADQRKH